MNWARKERTGHKDEEFTSINFSVIADELVVSYERG